MTDDVVPVQYEERYCAFIDILGFSEIVRTLRTDRQQFDFLRKLLNRVHSPPAPTSCQYDDTDFRSQNISDAVAISTTVGPGGLSQLFEALEALAVDLLIEGFFVRGAVVKGFLYHGPNTVFGDALIDAYNLEDGIVRFPRIMVTSAVADDYESNRKEGTYDCSSIIMQSEDGPLFLHVLRPLDNAFKAPTRRPSYTLQHWHMIREQIQRRLDKAVDNPSHFEKVRWFARYWNNLTPPFIPALPRIQGPGLDEKPAIWG